MVQTSSALAPATVGHDAGGGSARPVVGTRVRTAAEPGTDTASGGPLTGTMAHRRGPQTAHSASLYMWDRVSPSAPPYAYSGRMGHGAPPFVRLPGTSLCRSGRMPQCATGTPRRGYATRPTDRPANETVASSACLKPYPAGPQQVCMRAARHLPEPPTTRGVICLCTLGSISVPPA